MPVENSSANGFHEISSGLIVCNSCGKIHQVHGENRRPLKCENCSERFLSNSLPGNSAETKNGEQLVHYEVDCPKCGSHFEVDLPTDSVIFDCGECGCSFEIQGDSGHQISEPSDGGVQSVRKRRSSSERKRRSSRSRKKRRRKGGKGLSISKQKKKYPWLNSIVSFIVASVLCFGVVVYLIIKSFEVTLPPRKSGDSNKIPKLVDVDVEEIEEREELFFVQDVLGEDVERFLGVLQGFVGAQTLEEKAKFCRYPGETRVRMLQMYRNEIYEPESLEQMEQVGPVQVVVLSSGQTFVQASFTNNEGEEANYVAEYIDEVYRFEWEPSVQYSEVPWALVEEGIFDRSISALVKIESSTRFTSEHPPENFASYQVFRDGFADGFVAYTELGSEVETKLASVFSREQFPLLGVDDRQTTKRVVLKFDFPSEWNPDGRPRYGRILEVVQEDWVRYEL